MLGESSNDVQIRRFVLDDMAQVLGLISKINSEEDLVQCARAQFFAELENPHQTIVRFVATINGAVIGTMGIGPGPLPSSQVLWADWLVVDPCRRRRGVAKLLYTEIEAHALRLGKTCLCLDIGNIDRERAAYLFHQRNGFQIVGQIPDYWGRFEHLHIMTKFLGVVV